MMHGRSAEEVHTERYRYFRFRIEPRLLLFREFTVYMPRFGTLHHEKFKTAVGLKKRKMIIFGIATETREAK